MPSDKLSIIKNHIFMPARYKADSAAELYQNKGKGYALERYTKKHIS